jgi:KDO2-lipid IV(A) lauroyltransferase
MLGLDRSANFCSFIARKIGPFLPVTKTAIRNIERTLGKQVDTLKIIDGLWDNFGRFIGEFPFVSSLNENEIDKRIEIEGLENLSEFQQKNQPFLLCTGHFANWDFALRVINRCYPKFGIVYRKANNPYVDKFINESRNKNKLRLIAKGSEGVRDLVRSLKSKDSIAMLVDQKMNDGIEVPFFGIPAMTSHAIAKFAIQFKYPIIPCQIIRTNKSHFKIIIHKPLEYLETESNKNDCYNIMFKINKMFEQWIRENPSQWFWFHNRWGKGK